MEDHSQIGHVKETDNQIKQIKSFDIDFEGLSQFFTKLNSVCNEEDQIKAYDQLVQIFSFEFNSSAKTFENGLMIWRGMIMLLSNEKF